MILVIRSFVVEMSVWFIVVFVLLWVAGPLTQVLFLVAPKLHHRLGLTERDALKPEFKWFILDEKAIAIADMTYLIAGIVFVGLALLDVRSALIFGMYTCACYVYIAALTIPRWILLAKHELSPLQKTQMPFYVSYMIVFLMFGVYGLFYLWGLAQT